MLYKIREPVYICGDLHGHFPWIKNVIEKYDLCDCSIIFCGDVGLGFQSFKVWYSWMQESKLTSTLKNRNISCYFIRGNHDDPSWFDDKTLVTKNFVAVSDYSVLSSSNHNILCVGGGISIDRIVRKQQMHLHCMEYLKFHPDAAIEEAKLKTASIYWSNEAPVYNETAINELSCQIDTVCSHVAPVEFAPFTNPDKCWLDSDPELRKDCINERLAMSNVLRKLITNQHPLQKWYYGHYHFYEKGEHGEVSTILLDMAKNKGLCLEEL